MRLLKVVGLFKFSLSCIRNPSKPVTIEDTKGKVTGKIEMDNLIEGMKRPKSQGTNITG